LQRVCEKSDHNRVQLCIFRPVFLKINKCWSVSFEINWSNMRIIRSRMSTNRSSRQIIRSKRGLSVGSFLSSENARVAAKLLLEPSLTHYRMYTRLGRTSNIGALHFSCEANGWTNCHNKARNVLLWKNKSFIIWYVRTIICGLTFFR